MKKIIIAVALLSFLLPVFLMGFIAMTGSASYDSKVVASENQAYNYQYISSELGIPWDIVILSDSMKAWWDGLDSIESFNPLITALEFCILQEDIYKLTPIYEEVTYKDEETGTEYTRLEHVGDEWILEETVLYTGCDEILGYIDQSRDNTDIKDATKVVVDIMKVAEEKSSDEWKYDVTLVCNLDYDYVLGELIGLPKDDIAGIMELYHAQYMSELYGYIRPKEEIENIIVPTVPGHGITRNDLARIAVSLINWPYQFGSKSPYKGTPIVPLDCSGYVDWVYMQCFDIGVSAGGRIPAGVAVSGTAIQYYASDPIDFSTDELRIGDLGFIKDPRNVGAGESNHVGIYLGAIGGQQAWIHCAGTAYGYEDRPKGRVGISLASGSNSYDPITNTTFAPPMKSIRFRYFRRPRFVFADDPIVSEEEDTP